MKFNPELLANPQELGSTETRAITGMLATHIVPDFSYASITNASVTATMGTVADGQTAASDAGCPPIMAVTGKFTLNGDEVATKQYINDRLTGMIQALEAYVRVAEKRGSMLDDILSTKETLFG